MNNDENGRWVTMNGTHVFIKKGQSPEEALAEFTSRKKPEKYFEVKSKSLYGDTRVVPDTDIDKYKNNDYTITDIDISKELEAIDNMDLNKPYNILRKEIIMTASTNSQKRYLLGVLNDRIAEHQMNLADEFLSNIPKHKDVSLEESVLSVNFDHYRKSKSDYKYNTPEYAAYTYNCQRCVQAFVLRYCHGYDVEARPAQRVWNERKNKFDLIDDDIELDNYSAKNGYARIQYDMSSEYNGWEEVIFNRQDVIKTKMNARSIAIEANDDYISTDHQRRQINKLVKASGDGSVWIATVCWKGTRHYGGDYNAHTFCVINEGGKVKYLDPQTGLECSEYFTEKQIVPKKTEIFRADNCRLNGTKMKEVVTYNEPI